MRSNDIAKKMQRRVRILLLLVVAMLLSPIVVYVYKFGVNITDSHARWGEMGSAMSGLYTPILSLLTLAVLLAQVRLQDAMNKHAFDQSYIQEVRTDVQYYLSQLAKELSAEFDNGSEIGQELIAVFAYVPVKELRGQRYAEVAKGLNRKYPRIMSIWSAFYPLLAGLQANSHHPYEHNFSAAKQKAIVILSYEGCVALDNFIWCVSEGNLKFSYEFAQGLTETQ